MIKFLIVEDDQILSNNIQEIISDLGETKQVYDGSEGLYEALSGIYDPIVLDLMLPELNGYELLNQLRSAGQQTPVLVLTAKYGLEDKIKGFQKGADDYLTKPFYREELRMRIKALLKRSLGLFDENTLKYKSLVCDLNKNEVYFENQLLAIQGKESELLNYF